MTLNYGVAFLPASRVKSSATVFSHQIDVVFKAGMSLYIEPSDTFIMMQPRFNHDHRQKDFSS